jgi:ABC-2 type transport system permease protein
VLSTSFTAANLSPTLRRELDKLGGAAITTPKGALGFYFLLFVLAISLFACSQITALRRDEAEQRLETLFAQSVGRQRWLAGRLLLAAAAATLLALTAGVCAWAGAAGEGAGVPLVRLLEAGANCLPVSLLFLSFGALLFGVAPRLAVGGAYGLVSATFLWQLVGGLLGAPRWLLDLSPFRHVALVPAEPFRVGAAVILLALSAACLLTGLWAFRRRDLTGP